MEVVDGGRESKRTHLRAMEVEEDAMAVVVQVVDGGGWSRCPKLAFEGWGGAGGGGEGGGLSRGPQLTFECERGGGDGSECGGASLRGWWVQTHPQLAFACKGGGGGGVVEAVAVQRHPRLAFGCQEGWGSGGGS